MSDTGKSYLAISAVALLWGLLIGSIIEERTSSRSVETDTVYVAIPDTLNIRLSDIGFICTLAEEE